MKIVCRVLMCCWIGVCAVALLQQTRLLFGEPLVLDGLAGFVFGGTVFGYHFMQSEPWGRRLAWVLGAGAAGCIMLMPALARWATWLPLGVWALYYGFRRPGNHGWRSRPLIKPLAIALAWAGVTVLLPLDWSDWPGALVLLAGRAAFVFALALAYDLVDLDYDRRQGLLTLVGQLGPAATLRLFDGLLLASGVCVLLNFFNGRYTGPATAALLISLPGSAGLVRWVLACIRPSRLQKYWIDGAMILQFVLVWLAQQLG